MKGMKNMKQFSDLSHKVIGCAIEVHRALGPGLLESTYEQCLSYELSENNIPHTLQHPLPVIYKRRIIDCGYRIDIMVERQIIIELKSVCEVTEVHKAQILTYMKLANIKTGLLINFNVEKLSQGLQSFIL